jgi:carbamoyltransferase
MMILGIGGLGYRDSAAALIVDGRTVAAASEDRFSGVKHAGGWPVRSVAWCLGAAGATAADVDLVAVANNPWLPLRERVLGWYGDSFFRSREFRVHHMFQDEIHHSLVFLKMLEEFRVGSTDRVRVVRHHLSHMAAGFLAGDLEEAAVLVMDGRGEVSTSSQGIGRGAALEVFRCEEMPNSLGLLSAAVADYLGFHEQDDEFRVMSISSTGEPRFRAEFSEVVHLLPDGSYRLNPDFFTFFEGKAVLSERFHRTFGEPRAPGSAVEDRHRDIACSLQRALEEAALHMARHLADVTAARHLVLSGSMALNWALNARLAQEAPFETVGSSPFCADDGTALGAALLVHAEATGRRPDPVPDAALGPAITDAETARILGDCRLSSEHCADPARSAADLLSGGAIVGWCRGPAEFGPRALGRRSILASVHDRAVVDRLRRTVKSRESHHPFGISITADAANALLEDRARDRSMLVPATVRAAQRDRLPGLVLADGSVRVQVVDAARDPEFHALLQFLGKSTGVEAAVNTSLNLPGRPPALEVRDALPCFFTTGMDALMVGNHLLRKSGGAR